MILAREGSGYLYIVLYIYARFTQPWSLLAQYCSVAIGADRRRLLKTKTTKAIHVRQFKLAPVVQ